MSISVNSLSKLYGQQKALDEVTFHINSGEVVGLLGPNGAGKSTIMKILTCFIPPTSGKASVCDKDVIEQSVEVRKKVGYLPESNPLYTDMYVHEYLEFIAGLHKLPGNKRLLANEMIEITGLQVEQNKKIGQLSKGYRQRVGLAQAMIHKPEVLILDEPTSGLDPNQLIEIRGLIKEIGKEKTVMLSTHIMQEVEAMCGKVVIINKGKIVANIPVEGIGRYSNDKTTLIVEFASEVNTNLLQKIAGVLVVNEIQKNKFEMVTKKEIDIRPIVFKFAVDNQLTILSLNLMEQNLENVFHQLTQQKKI